MQVETKSASLDTLSVTIQALHVNGKQMTLAVFRQLPTAEAYRDDGYLCDFDFWGLVRYSIKGSGDEWVICSKDGRLYRCYLNWPGLSASGANQKLKREEAQLLWWERGRDYRNRICPSLDKISFRGQSWDESLLPFLNKNIEDALAYVQHCEQAEKSRNILRNLPQLFIAV